MPSSRSPKSKAKPSKPARRPIKSKPSKATPKKPTVPPKTGAKPVTKKASAPAAAPPEPIPEIRRADGRRHLLSLSFVRDGDEFMARMETDSGHITELKNRALDQLLTLVAGELEDLLE